LDDYGTRRYGPAVFIGREVLKEILMEMEAEEYPVQTSAQDAPIEVDRQRNVGAAFTIAGDIHRYARAGSHHSRPSTSGKSRAERRDHRRHDMETQNLVIERWDETRRSGRHLGTIVDLSASGVRIRTGHANVRPDVQIRVRLELPAFAGISPFIHGRDKALSPAKQWVGWITVSRVARINKDEYDVAGRLIDMDEIDRGMLGLYLSAQPLTQGRITCGMPARRVQGSGCQGSANASYTALPSPPEP
jgi:hypothetical protein